MVQFHVFLLESVLDIQAMIPIYQPQSWISVRLILRLLELMASCNLLVEHTS